MAATADGVKEGGLFRRFLRRFLDSAIIHSVSLYMILGGTGLRTRADDCEDRKGVRIVHMGRTSAYLVQHGFQVVVCVPRRNLKGRLVEPMHGQSHD